jgi:hypothetical protein
VSDGIVVGLLVLSVLIGIGGASFLVFRSPAFWGDLMSELAAKAWPQIVKIITKRMDPKTEAEWRRCMLRGGKWDHRRKRCDR